MAQLMPLPLTVYCFIKIQIGSTFLVPADPGSPGTGPLNGCVCVCLLWPIGLEISTDVAYGQIKWLFGEFISHLMASVRRRKCWECNESAFLIY